MGGDDNCDRDRSYLRHRFYGDDDPIDRLVWRGSLSLRLHCDVVHRHWVDICPNYSVYYRNYGWGENRDPHCPNCPDLPDVGTAYRHRSDEV